MLRTRFAIAAGTALAVIAVSTAASAQSAANREAAQLLSPFTTLNNSAAGRTALQQNLAGAIAVNNNADAARRQRAIDDNTQSQDGRQFTVGLGSTLDAAYQAAIAANDGRVSTLNTLFGKFTAVPGGDSAFLKTFYANGTTNGTTPATGITLPAGGQFNTYDTAYGVTTAQPGQNPYGDSRPFQVAPDQIQNFAPTITAGLISNSAFPSGHTTFGTTEALLEAIAVPERFQTEIARALDYGYSRVVLGAHYPLDVIGGRILALHDVANLLNNNPTYTGGQDFKAAFSSFQSTFRSTLSDYAGTSIAAAAAADTGPYSNAAQVAADAEFRNTYALSAVGPTDLAPVVPVGAEVLLMTRFAYLSGDQRRDVLASTELASGGALDDGSGWARIDLFKAGGGYGAFTGQTVITQDASQGGSAAADTFSNDIGGTGGFTHMGTGSLTLTGNNSFTGNVVIADGRVIAASRTALGKGNVSLTGGVLEVATPSLEILGDFSELAGGLLRLSETGSADPLVTIDGLASLDGALGVDLSGLANQGGEYELLGYGSHDGEFASVSYTGLGDGYLASLAYRAGGLFLDITPNAGAVPEPATWATLMVGFGLIGGSIRRRAGASRSVQAV